MKLKIYLCTNNITQTDFAKKLGISRSHLNLIVSGKQRPSKSLANLIETITEGEVTANYMLTFGSHGRDRK